MRERDKKVNICIRLCLSVLASKKTNNKKEVESKWWLMNQKARNKRVLVSLAAKGELIKTRKKENNFM